MGFVPIWALGLMSGTSLDGVDGAMILTDGACIVEFGDSFFRPYTMAEQIVLRQSLGLWQDADHTILDKARNIVQMAHRHVIDQFSNIDIIGFHGQTLAHAPQDGRTHQLGDGHDLAQYATKTVIWDFRSNDIKNAGEGAPLAPFFHFACGQYLGLKQPVAFVNLGGVGNITWLNPCQKYPEDHGALLAFDSGPANAPINDLMYRHGYASYDKNGSIAAQGCVDQKIVKYFCQQEYFKRLAPKSLDRNSFTQLPNLIKNLSLADGLATLNAIIVATISLAQRQFPQPVKQWYICGGGRKNKYLIKKLRQELNAHVDICDSVDLNGDMLEAQAFGFLAVRVRRNMATSAPATTRCNAPTGGGIISLSSF